MYVTTIYVKARQHRASKNQVAGVKLFSPLSLGVAISNGPQYINPFVLASSD
jgi:hypothetical protein